MLRSFLFIAAAVFVLPAVISMPFSVLLPTSTRSMFFMFMPNLRTILLSRQSNISAAIWAGLWLLLHVLIITMGNPSHFITTGMNTTNTFRKRFLSSTSYRNWLSIYRKNTLKWPGIMVFMPNIINRKRISVNVFLLKNNISCVLSRTGGTPFFSLSDTTLSAVPNVALLCWF